MRVTHNSCVQAIDDYCYGWLVAYDQEAARVTQTSFAKGMGDTLSESVTALMKERYEWELGRYRLDIAKDAKNTIVAQAYFDEDSIDVDVEDFAVVCALLVLWDEMIRRFVMCFWP